jgi:hypothetical protein
LTGPFTVRGSGTRGDADAVGVVRVGTSCLKSRSRPSTTRVCPRRLRSRRSGKSGSPSLRVTLARMADISQLLEGSERGDPVAAEALLPVVYDELRKLAAVRLGQEGPGQTLDATGLVHEAYMRLVGPPKEGPAAGWQGRGHFFAAAGEAMRRTTPSGRRATASLAPRRASGPRRRSLTSPRSGRLPGGRSPIPDEERIETGSSDDSLDDTLAVITDPCHPTSRPTGHARRILRDRHVLPVRSLLRLARRDRAAYCPAKPAGRGPLLGRTLGAAVGSRRHAGADDAGVRLMGGCCWAGDAPSENALATKPPRGARAVRLCRRRHWGGDRRQRLAC